MNEPAYLTSARDALKIIETAIEEAKILLPEDVIKRHWMAAKHSPNAWESVQFWYLGQEGSTEQTADVIMHIKCLSHCAASLASVLMPKKQEVTKDDLRLAKVRCTA